MVSSVSRSNSGGVSNIENTGGAQQGAGGAPQSNDQRIQQLENEINRLKAGGGSEDLIKKLMEELEKLKAQGGQGSQGPQAGHGAQDGQSQQGGQDGAQSGAQIQTPDYQGSGSIGA